jgi:polysaccharide biosynthesis/export protein
MLAVSLRAQQVPDYSERSLFLLRDSLTSSAIQPQVEASEGSIDPTEYVTGPGDKLFISISGIEDVNLNLTINQEGLLFIPRVGGIDLKNFTLARAKEKIKNEINRYYKNVDVFISLVDFRKIKVSLLGDVRKPSSFVLPGNARLIDLVMNSMGLNPTSNYRYIKIISRNGDTLSCDLLSFIRFGNRKQNPMLREGDAVIVDRIDKTISVFGSVKYPAVYEYVEGETADNLISLAGGFLFAAKKDTIELVRYSADGKTLSSSYYAYSDLKNGNVLLQPQDKVLIREMPDYYTEKLVRIDGFVKYPGYYKINEEKTTLSQIISEAGGFRPDASLIEATLSRTMGTVELDPELERIKLIQRAELTDDEYDYMKAKSRQRAGKVVVDFVKLFRNNDKEEDVILKRGDIINVPEAKNYVILLGQVVNPGNIMYQENLSVDDYIKLAGGYAWRALKGDVRVVKANTGEWVDADDIDKLDPGDTIWIPEDPPARKFWDVFTTTLTVVGQIASVIAATVAVIIATR